jgi:hypothetical protein
MCVLVGVLFPQGARDHHGDAATSLLNPCQDNDIHRTAQHRSLARTHTCTHSQVVHFDTQSTLTASHTDTLPSSLATCLQPSSFGAVSLAPTHCSVDYILLSCLSQRTWHLQRVVVCHTPHSDVSIITQLTLSVLLSRSNTSIWVVRSANEAKVIARRYLLYTRHIDHPSSIQPESSPSLREAALRRRWWLSDKHCRHNEDATTVDWCVCVCGDSGREDLVEKPPFLAASWQVCPHVTGVGYGATGG